MVAMASPARDLDPGANLQMAAMLAHERSLASSRLTEGDPSDLLSARELECMRWVAAGKTDWEIGAILLISATTVKFHVNRARAKLGARNRAQATTRLVLYGLF
jgi:DNA-binding CsgD family transcriptional regulator